MMHPRLIAVYGGTMRPQIGVLTSQSCALRASMICRIALWRRLVDHAVLRSWPEKPSGRRAGRKGFKGFHF
jgi:hypothetical protein